MPVKPTSSEEEYFALENAEKKRKLALAEAKKMAEAERKKQRELHHMHCPKCGMHLQEIAYRGVAIDKCFSCNGMWLDEGELEKLGGGNGEPGYVERIIGFFTRKDFHS